MSMFPRQIPATDALTDDPVALLGVVLTPDPKLLALYPDGSLRLIELGVVSADLRYDFKNGKWIDVSWGALNVEDSEEDDWGESVPGHVSDPDRASDGDQSDQADNDTWDVDSDEGEDQ